MWLGTMTYANVLHTLQKVESFLTWSQSVSVLPCGQFKIRMDDQEDAHVAKRYKFALKEKVLYGCLLLLNRLRQNLVVTCN